MRKFDVAQVYDDICVWVRAFYSQFDPSTTAVLGISGGKDSLIAGAVLSAALGKDRVIGVSIPNGKQSDMYDVKQTFHVLGIHKTTINIEDAYKSITDQLETSCCNLTSQCEQNLPPRLRMSVLYAVAQIEKGLVVNTCNLSEDYIGWETKFGDDAGDFSLFADLTKTEVCELGDFIGLPNNLVHKDPADGLCGKTDEMKFGFTYEELDKYLSGETIDPKLESKIEYMHRQARHKDFSSVIPHFVYKPDAEQRKPLFDELYNVLI